MKRKTAISNIMSKVTDEVVISSVGMISRELHEVKDRDRNFYVMGSMGCELALGLGLAYSRPDLKVVVISGDGSALMSLGTIVLQKHLSLKNLVHYILDNGCHATTGGQPTISNCVDFESLAPHTYVIKVSNELGDAPRIPLSPRRIKERLYASINK